MLLYAAAVRALSGRAPVTGLVYYVDEDRLCEVALTDDQVEYAVREAQMRIAQLRAPQ